VFLKDEPLPISTPGWRPDAFGIAQRRTVWGSPRFYVTHDQVEAMTMGDRVALLRDGVLQQIDTPTNIYNHPANTFVASFIVRRR